ncbi:uncharacterized protein LOC125261223 isoform X3 [Megalobrama amblycephala]|uniref:uncharacterized protein LOC125261223 isoform X3 n=1 Tax=Megalobrama amblycephala TaxID=75352 RepID=UPI0020147735|nr:uncharacterized protein LOC125261223 isoform X3 [Megalobrama amblycephala]XP_048035797.1 uncharacterized protein LOC125261223 isoform X3 [Megalobrama amblycephala]
MESSQDPCPHLSMPVETDESMTLSSLNLVWPACQQCQSHNTKEAGTSARFSPEMCVHDVSRLDYLDGCCGLTPKVLRVSPFNKLSISDSQHTASPAGLPSLYLPQSSGRHIQRDCRAHIEDLSEDFSGINIQNRCNSAVLYSSARNPVSEDEESLEEPSPLRSDLGENFCRYSPPKHPGFYDEYPPEVLYHWRKQPANYPQPNYPLYQPVPEHARHYVQNRASAGCECHGSLVPGTPFPMILVFLHLHSLPSSAPHYHSSPAPGLYLHHSLYIGLTPFTPCPF